MENSLPVRICSAQIASIWEDPDKTLKKAGLYIRHAATCGASLICFPEQFATGWDPESHEHLQDINGSIVSTLQDLAQENRISILGSFRERGVQFPKNTAVVIAHDGQVLTTYSKIHLFSPGSEHACFLPGNGLGLFTLGTLTCGIAICYDLRFPDLFRIYAQKGVDAVFVPAAWPAQRMKHWELFVTARAAENQMYVVGINTTGRTPVDFYQGGSMTADPQGTVVSRVNNTEQLVFTDLDPAMSIITRRQFPVGKDRKDALYRKLSDTSISK